MDDTFLKAALIQPPSVLGVQLRPFCAGHAIILEALDNPFMFKPKEGQKVKATAADLFMALFFCSRTFEQGREDLSRPDLERCFLKLGRKHKRWYHRKYQDQVEAACDLFDEYIADYTDVPEHHTIVGATDVRAPAIYAVVIGLMKGSRGAISESEAWNMGFSKALCYGATMGDLEGSETLVTEEDRAGSAGLDAAIAAKEKRQQTAREAEAAEDRQIVQELEGKDGKSSNQG